MACPTRNKYEIHFTLHVRLNAVISSLISDFTEVDPSVCVTSPKINYMRGVYKQGNTCWIRTQNCVVREQKINESLDFYTFEQVHCMKLSRNVSINCCIKPIWVNAAIFKAVSFFWHETFPHFGMKPKKNENDLIFLGDRAAAMVLTVRKKISVSFLRSDVSHGNSRVEKSLQIKNQEANKLC